MIVSFKNQGTEDIFDGNSSKDARKTCPVNLWNVAQRKLDQLNAAISLDDMKIPPGNKLEALQGDREGQHSIRLNKQYRICFVWTNEGACEVEIVDYHD
ncbi:plasmid maintenance system killer protein [Nostoc sp. MBR 210]|nr:plasmid maintenance system killer protein [Nostoc sp. MBR 210]